jgi:RNA polymerase sigma-70 factor (sigma-E family)
VLRCEEAEFTEFVNSQGHALLRFARVLSRSQPDAEDLLQTALLRLARVWHRELSAPDAYVRRVLINLAADRRRALSRRVTELLVGSMADRMVPQSGTQGFAPDLDEVLARLPARQRTIVVLRYVEGYSELETARLLGCSIGTVKSQASRGRARLRVLLAQVQLMDAAVVAGGNE